MDSELWDRISARIAALPGGSGREVAWLAEKLATSQQRVYNWTKRGVPSSALPDIAAALGWTVDQVLGHQEAAPAQEWPFDSISPERFASLTPKQQALVELAARAELERIEAAQAKQPRAVA